MAAVFSLFTLQPARLLQEALIQTAISLISDVNWHIIHRSAYYKECSNIQQKKIKLFFVTFLDAATSRFVVILSHLPSLLANAHEWGLC